MKKIDLIAAYIQQNTSAEALTAALAEGAIPGATADDVQEKLGIVRNNASTMLNQLWKEGRLIKITSRPVSFFSAAHLQPLRVEYALPPKNSYTLAELKAALSERASVKDPFEHLIGGRGSLANQIGQAKAAIVYPPRGLHTLILGESGVGKTTFAAAMHAYGLQVRNKTNAAYPFVTFNCADYFNNPQLLLSQLFGHVKHAFTGAERDKPGLVEKADGGILFLDEIHRLPPDGQEMLFYLMDKGEYSRLGESTARRAGNVLIVAATTEEPSGTLLATFIRRIPVVITLPAFADKPIAERVETVDRFFHYEAVALQKEISLAPEVLRALAAYKFGIGNIGQLRSEIKLLCAKAFLRHLQNAQPLGVDFSMLSAEIRESLFDYAKLGNDAKNYLNMFNEEIRVSPDENQAYSPFEIKDDLYERIAQKLDALKRQGLSNASINDALRGEIEGYFGEIMKNFHIARVNVQMLYKLIPKKIVDATAELIEFAEHHLHTKFNTKFIFGLSFHIQALLKRIRSHKTVQNEHLAKIRRDHPKEFAIAAELTAKLGEMFGLSIPDDERGFLALLLAHNQARAPHANKIGVIIVCHGNTTATSIADVANALLNTDWIKAVDMPLSAGIAETYEKVRGIALTLYRGKGILLLTDMGSLLEFGAKLTQDTGIPTKVIDGVSTPLALEALRGALYKDGDLDALHRNLSGLQDLPSVSGTGAPAVLSVCVTGQGTSRLAEQILANLLRESEREDVKILVVNYLDVRKRLPMLCQSHRLLAAVGNIDPDIGIPYFSVARLADEDFRDEFLRLLTAAPPLAQFAAPQASSVADRAKLLLEQYVKFVNPKLAVEHIQKSLEAVGRMPADAGLALDLIVHMGCMLDRCMHQDAILFENAEEFKKQHPEDFAHIRRAADELQQEYDLAINDDEVCYIIKILHTRR